MAGVTVSVSVRCRSVLPYLYAFYCIRIRLLYKSTERNLYYIHGVSIKFNLCIHRLHTYTYNTCNKRQA